MSKNTPSKRDFKTVTLDKLSPYLQQLIAARTYLRRRLLALHATENYFKDAKNRGKSELHSIGMQAMFHRLIIEDELQLLDSMIESSSKRSGIKPKKFGLSAPAISRFENEARA